MARVNRARYSIKDKGEHVVRAPSVTHFPQPTCRQTMTSSANHPLMDSCSRKRPVPSSLNKETRGCAVLLHS